MNRTMFKYLVRQYDFGVRRLAAAFPGVGDTTKSGGKPPHSKSSSPSPFLRPQQSDLGSGGNTGPSSPIQAALGFGLAPGRHPQSGARAGRPGLATLATQTTRPRFGP